MTCAEFSSDGKRLVSACRDGTVRVWDSATGTTISPPMRHTGEVWHVAFSLDGKRVATASYDGTARVWEAPRVSFHPGGKQLAVTAD